MKKTYGDCIIRNERGEILLLQRSYQDDFEPGKWCLPGGKVESGETPIEGAMRELWEETNLKCLLEGPLHIEKRLDSVSYYFQGVAHTFDPTLLDVEEHYRMQWVPVTEIADYDLLLDLKDILANKIKLPIFDVKMMEIDVLDIEDLMKRQDLAEAAFDKGEIDAQDYFDVKEIVQNYAAALIERDPNRKPNNYEERLKKLKARRDPDGIEKSHQDELEKGGKRAFIGEIREFGGRKHIRTVSGWKYYGEGKGAKAKAHKERFAKTSIASEEDVFTVERLRDLERIFKEDGSHLSSRYDTDTLQSMLDDVIKYKAKSSREFLHEFSSRLEVALLLKRMAARKETSSKATTLIPEITMLDIDRGVSAGGSGGAMLVSDKALSDKKYIVKKATVGSDKNSLKQLEGELLADQIYDAMGVKTMVGQIKRHGEDSYKITPYLEGAKNLDSVSSTDKTLAKASLQKNFVLDCLLLNWDVIGASRDNIVVKGGIPYRIDNGGSLLYRAKNGKKTPSSLTEAITELDVMRSDKNPSAKAIFGDLTDVDIKMQAKLVYAGKDTILNTVKNSSASDRFEIAELLEKRLEWLKKNYIDEKSVKEKVINVTQQWEEKILASSFDANPESKEAIVKQVKAIEKRRESQYIREAERRGISVEELKFKLQEHVEKLAAKAELFRATDLDVLDLVLKDRFKSQFETGTSHGSLTPTGRAQAEFAYFGFPNDKGHDKENRPIYGYCSDNENGVQNYNGSHPPRNAAAHYGEVTVKLKGSVKNRATFCFADSLGVTDSYACTPLVSPHFTSLPVSGLEVESLSKFSRSYVEVQYHKQLKASDIASIHLSKDNIGGFERLNEALNIAANNGKKIQVYGDK